MILKINDADTELMEKAMKFTSDNPKVRIFADELSAFASVEIDKRIENIDVPEDIDLESLKDNAEEALYEYLLRNETAFNYDEMDNVVRDALGIL